MARTPASRIQRVQPPATLTAGEKARQLARQGHDVIDLGQSSPHHVTPRHIVDAGIQALNQGLTNISSSRGLPEWRQAMAEKLRGPQRPLRGPRHGHPGDPRQQDGPVRRHQRLH